MESPAKVRITYNGNRLEGIPFVYWVNTDIGQVCSGPTGVLMLPKTKDRIVEFVVFGYLENF